MSDPGSGPAGDTDDDPDLRAAEYALGVLDDAESRALEARSFTDPALARSIAAWQHRLAPLADLLPLVPPPPTLWRRLALAAGLESPPPPHRAGRFWRSPGLWRATTAASVAVAASLAFLLHTAPAPTSPPSSPLVAALTPYGAAPATFLVRVGPDGAATVLAVAAASVPQGRALELWAVQGQATPVSLGLLPAAGRATLVIRQPADTQLLVSQEPAGGSPTRAPTGPVVFAGRLSGL